MSREEDVQRGKVMTMVTERSHEAEADVHNDSSYTSCTLCSFLAWRLGLSSFDRQDPTPHPQLWSLFPMTGSRGRGAAQEGGEGKEDEDERAHKREERRPGSW